VEATAGTFYEPAESGPIRAWAEFITGRASPNLERRLTTLLFLDVVESTDLIATAGDAKWSQIRGDLDAWVTEEIHRFDGVIVQHTGDGYLACFENPGDAVRSAVAVTTGAHTLGVEVRAGVHTGEVELRDGGDVGGMSVHIAARVMASASPREVLVSRTVGDFLVGSEFVLANSGKHELKGVPGEWQLFAVLRRGIDTGP
jgi:class 3 adenylate cyclase